MHLRIYYFYIYPYLLFIKVNVKRAYIIIFFDLLFQLFSVVLKIDILIFMIKINM